MARLARVEVFAADEVAIVHVINRTVRRCFLMGDDPLTRKNYDHRKAWMERELDHLARFFSIDLVCFAENFKGGQAAKTDSDHQLR